MAIVRIVIDPDLPKTVREVVHDVARQHPDLIVLSDWDSDRILKGDEPFNGLITWNGLIPGLRNGVRCFYILVEAQELQDAVPGPFYWRAYSTGPPIEDETDVHTDESIELALDAMARWIDSFFDSKVRPSSDALTARQTRNLERLIGDLQRLIDTGAIRSEHQPVVLANIETIHVQLQSGQPDSGIIRKSLGHLATFAGGVVRSEVGVLEQPPRQPLRTNRVTG